MLLVGRGWVGTKMYSELVRRKHNVTFVSHTNAFYQLEHNTYDWVINAAAVTGNPNVESCELDKLNTFQGNTIFPIELYEASNKKNIRFAHFSSGCIYQGEINSVDSDANFFGSSYVTSKVLSDTYLKNKAQVYRIRMPFTSVDEPRNFLTKIIKYATTGKLCEGGLNSLTYLDDAITVACNLIEEDAPNGPYNLVNKGAVTMRELSTILKLNPSWFTPEEFRALSMCDRSNCVIPSYKAYDNMPSIHDRLQFAVQQLLNTEVHSDINACPITDSTEHMAYFHLGDIPLVNNLCDTKDQSFESKKFPLTLNFYPSSGLTSINFAVNSRLMFSHYLYKSSVNIPYIEHCKNMFEFIKNYVQLKNDMLFVDVGGNDGTLLHTFKSNSEKHINVLNIDPSKNLAIESIKKGVPVLTDFFTPTIAQQYKNSVDVLTSTNVFQHLKDINSFVKAVRMILSDRGVWILEFPYWLHDMLTNQFDQIYHEHVYYYTLTPLNKLMAKHGLKVVNVTQHSIHGKSLRLVITKDTSQLEIDKSVEEQLLFESSYNNLEFYKQWGKSISTHIHNSKQFLLGLKNQNKKIYGFGAAAKGCVYLNAMGIDDTVIDFIIDDTDIKQGKYVPGTGIQVVSRDILTKEPPDYILILAHNFADYIVKSLSSTYSGKFIVLLPEIREVI